MTLNYRVSAADAAYRLLHCARDTVATVPPGFQQCTLLCTVKASTNSCRGRYETLDDTRRSPRIDQELQSNSKMIALYYAKAVGTLAVNIKPIKTEADYEAALEEIDRLMDAEPDTPEGDRLDVLTTLVEAWEQKHYQIEDREAP